MTRRLAPWLALGCAACGGGDALPAPELGEVEPLVRLEIARRAEAAASDRSADNLSRYARVLHAHGMLAEAEHVYLLAAGCAGEDLASECLHLAGCAMAPLQPERAVEHLTAALALRPDREAGHLRLAILAERLGKVDVARDHYEKAVALRPSSHAWLGLGRLLLQAGDPRAAVEQLERARALDPDHHQVDEALARAYARLGQAEASRQAAQRAGNLSAPRPIDDPLMAAVNDADVTYRAFEGRAIARFDEEHRRALATGRRDKALLEQALDAIDSACRARPDSPTARHYRGLILAGLGRVDEAIAELQAVVAARPDDENAGLALAGMLRAAGRASAALVQLDALLERRPRCVDALMQRAALHLEAHETEAARRDLRAILDVAPDNEWARARLRE
ncbi:MAG: tetratricopeptide repeat protein [Planctomycetes bacterium]|nr:tetratricopeptide repeat protein [Planctomycetota bacterium]